MTPLTLKQQIQIIISQHPEWMNNSKKGYGGFTSEDATDAILEAFIKALPKKKEYNQYSQEWYLHSAKVYSYNQALDAIQKEIRKDE